MCACVFVYVTKHMWRRWTLPPAERAFGSQNIERNPKLSSRRDDAGSGCPFHRRYIWISSLLLATNHVSSRVQIHVVHLKRSGARWSSGLFGNLRNLFISSLASGRGERRRGSVVAGGVPLRSPPGALQRRGGGNRGGRKVRRGQDKRGQGRRRHASESWRAADARSCSKKTKKLFYNKTCQFVIGKYKQRAGIMARNEGAEQLHWARNKRSHSEWCEHCAKLLSIAMRSRDLREADHGWPGIG